MKLTELFKMFENTETISVNSLSTIQKQVLLMVHYQEIDTDNGEDDIITHTINELFDMGLISDISIISLSDTGQQVVERLLNQ